MPKRKPRTHLLRLVVRLGRYVDRWWYVPLLGLMAGADFFIFVIPTDLFIVSTSALRPKRWFWIGAGTAVGSALGAALLSVAIGHWGEDMIQWIAPGALESEKWRWIAHFLQHYGFWALAALAFGPLPLHLAVIVASTAHIPPFFQFLAYTAGRAAKYVLFAWLASHAPRLMRSILGKMKSTGIENGVAR